MENLLNNPWAVTVGGGVIVVAFSYYVIGIGRAKGTHKGKPANGEKRDNVDSFTKFTPKKIVDEIEKLPPFQQESLAESYKDIRVKNWDTTLYSARRIENGKVHLMLMDRGHYPWIYADVEEKGYPELKIVRKGKKIIISGIIKNVDGNVIELKEAKLRL